ncbi:hypothetical protein SCLCIDRAFT_28674 [Scleroderma citrinum Foug A]|uniref:Uncharacterized protein n=1 Tax=Scleroderma citrinum Foug A TaxID=1036808 RepID=A0A0C2YM84_9AGAM|nr:hypothetical protein SCLCIDRAFT_33919 [Scleroderma citrinum Foug A]KIM57578.1 hypothetical protein SCLCIDRAFT_28674 [Scleroderma citrinum Foug A]
MSSSNFGSNFSNNVLGINWKQVALPNLLEQMDDSIEVQIVKEAQRKAEEEKCKAKKEAKQKAEEDKRKAKEEYRAQAKVKRQQKANT